MIKSMNKKSRCMGESECLVAVGSKLKDLKFLKGKDPMAEERL